MEEFILKEYQWIISTIIAIIALLWGANKIIKKNKQHNNNIISNKNCTGDMLMLNMPISINELNLPIESQPIVKSFLNQIATFLKDKGIQDTDFLSKINNKFAIYDAIKTIARNDIPEKRLILCQLLAEKIRQDKSDDSDDEYAQAIKAINNISLYQIEILSFIEISTSILSFQSNYHALSKTNIDRIIQFVSNIPLINIKEIKYIEHLNLIYNIYPQEHDRKDFIAREENEELLLNNINAVLNNDDTIRLNSYILSKTGRAIAKTYINNHLDLDYINSSKFPLKYADFTANNIIGRGNVVAHAISEK